MNTGKKVPQLFVLDLKSDSVTAVKGLPEDASCGQPIWTPDGKGHFPSIVKLPKITEDF